MIEKIKTLCQKANEEYLFSYNSLLDENYKTQQREIGEKFVYLEEQKSGYFSFGMRLKRQTNFVLYVCTMIDALEKDNAEAREEVRKMMRREFLNPFLRLFVESDMCVREADGVASSIPFESPLPMFDNYAVVEILSLKCVENIC